MDRRIAAIIEGLARLTAYAGGLVLLAVVIMTCISITGRSLSDFIPSLGPIPGDFELVADLLMLIAAALITWRLWQGMLDKKGYSETTFILQFPVWIAYAAGLVGAVVFVLVAIYCLWRSLRALGGDRA